MPKPIRVLLADNHEIVREGLRVLLEREKFEIVGDASNGIDAVRSVRAKCPDVAVLAVSMPRMNGLDAACEMLAARPGLGVVLLAMDDNARNVGSALRAGVRGYMVKSEGVDEIVKAIREVAAGGTYLSVHAAASVIEGYCEGGAVPVDPLTSKERQILQLIAEGMSTKQAASLLGLSIKSAESHRMRLMRKLNIHDTVNLVRYAVKHGLVHLYSWVIIGLQNFEFTAQTRVAQVDSALASLL